MSCRKASRTRSRRPRKRSLPATRGITDSNEPLDVVLISLYGTWGEDGRIQGLLDTIGIPYTGSGVLASALAMDKVMAKTVLAAAGLDVPRGAGRDRCGGYRAGTGTPRSVSRLREASWERVERGASIVRRAEELAPAIVERAAGTTSAPSCEEYLKGTELTVPVIGNDDLTALPVIEIVTQREFFDYHAKYDAGASEEIVPRAHSRGRRQNARRISPWRAHRALGCRGMSRTDLRVGRRSGWSRSR